MSGTRLATGISDHARCLEEIARSAESWFFTMKAFGYAKRTITDQGLLEMGEVTFTGSPSSIREIASFLLAAAVEMEKHQGRFDHSHIGEVCESWLDEWPDIIVVRT
jgi:hypothetical protein